MTRTLHRTQWVDAPLIEVFDFFSRAENLERITPPAVQFHILSDLPLDMRTGLNIDYRIVLTGIPMRWRTLISAWEPPHRFVDEQLRGPYKQWIHEHVFSEENGGTRMTDTVTYEAPGWIFEPLIHRFFVGPRVKAIFDYRAEVLSELFGQGRPPRAQGEK